MATSFQKFEEECEKWILTTFREMLNSSEASEQAILSKPLQLFFSRRKKVNRVEVNSDISIKYPKLFSSRSLIKYAILSWYLPPYTQILLQEVLEVKATRLHFPEVKSYLYSKKYMLANLYLETDYKHSEIFGNLLTKGVQNNIRTSEGEKRRITATDSVLLVLCNSSTAKRKVRRRGYNDQGSRAPKGVSAAREEAKGDIYLTLLHQKLEKTLLEEKLSYLRNLRRLHKFIEDFEGREG